MERIQLKYIKWTLGLNRRIADYVVVTETSRKKIQIKAERRVTKFQESIRTSTDRVILKEYVKRRKRTQEIIAREEYLRRNSYSQQV